MDEINKRVLYILDAKFLSKNAFAAMLEVSQPVLTHIASGRNKPGLELITKILTNFPDISPDWLLLGKEPMYRVEKPLPNIDNELQKLQSINEKLIDFEINANQVQEYHEILFREISYLKELNTHLIQIKSQSKSIEGALQDVKSSLESKLKQ